MFVLNYYILFTNTEYNLVESFIIFNNKITTLY